MPELAPRRSKGRPRGGKTGRLRRSPAEMNALYEAVMATDVKGFNRAEAVAYLESEGIRITPARYDEVRRKMLGRTRELTYAMGDRIHEVHYGAIVEMRSLRAELWRRYYRVRDPDPNAEIEPPERARMEAEADRRRMAIADRILLVEQAVASLTEDAGRRKERDARSAPLLAAAPSPLPAPAASSSAASSVDAPAAEVLVPDPDRPGILTLAAAARP